MATDDLSGDSHEVPAVEERHRAELRLAVLVSGAIIILTAVVLWLCLTNLGHPAAF